MKRIFILLIALVTYISVPNTTYAFQLERLIDPLCLFACDNEPQNVTNNSTTNVNSNVNSPGASITNVNSNNNPGTTAGTVFVPINNTPTYNYNDSSYNTPLSVSCSSNPTSGMIGDSIYWKAYVSGGNSSYYMTWSGSEGLYGNGNSITKQYNSYGTKNASITVTSGSQTVSKNCNSVEIYDYARNNTYYQPTYIPTYTRDYYYTNGYYNSNYYSNSPLYVSCSANVTFSPIGANVTWQASATGGSGLYSYNWTGTDNLYGYSQYINTTYNNLGVKNALVTVSSGGQTISQICSNTVTVGTPSYYNGYAYASNNYNVNYVLNNGFQIACYPDKTTAKVGTPVTWGVEAIAPNGVANNSLSYLWYGTDNLGGSQTNALIVYDNPGTKTANVTVIAPNGQRATQVCGNGVYITKNIGTKAATKAVIKSVETTKASTDITTTKTDTNNAIFSLGNIPWGFVAILIIIVLLCMVFYLMINKNKI